MIAAVGVRRRRACDGRHRRCGLRCKRLCLWRRRSGRGRRGGGLRSARKRDRRRRVAVRGDRVRVLARRDRAGMGLGAWRREPLNDRDRLQGEADVLGREPAHRPCQAGRQRDPEQSGHGPQKTSPSHCHRAGTLVPRWLSAGKGDSDLGSSSAVLSAPSPPSSRIAIAPPPARSIVTSPPQSRVSSRAIGKPSPSPGGPDRPAARDESARNELAFLGHPGPRSRTSIRPGRLRS